MQTEITVGIPFYNAEDYLADSVNSVLNQSYTNWCLILINDGSTDNSLKIAESFIGDPRIKIINDGMKCGLSIRLNQLADISSSNFIARMDADDIMHPDRLHQQILFLSKNPQVDIVGSGVVAIDENNIPYTKRLGSDIPTHSFDFLKKNIFNHATIAGKTSWFKKNRYSDKYGVLVNGIYNRLEDYELWYRAFENSTYQNLPEYLLFYREINIPFYKKYLQTNITLRQFLKETKINYFNYLYLKMLSHIKDAVYGLFFFLGKENHLILKRGSALTKKEKINYRKIIELAIKPINN